MTDIVERLRRHNDAAISFGRDYSDLFLDAADEIERLRALHNWRDIATAPKDGTKILVAWGKYCFLAHYEQDATAVDGGFWATDNAIVVHPSHYWMPLPMPPEVLNASS